MILDTNALSAWADGDPAIEPLLRTASRLVIPVVVIGEFEFGIRQSRHASRYDEWLAVNLDTVEVARIDRAIAAADRVDKSGSWRPSTETFVWS